MKKFETDEEAFELDKSTPYGLAAGIWTNDAGRAHRLSRRLNAGTVCINMYRMVSPMSPFGGFKSSGFGKENGLDSLNDYTRVKSVWLNTDG
jgi:aldehyde dehydrogenase (NAD+)